MNLFNNPVGYLTGKLVGLTGLYCAGKNHIAALLERRGLPVLDVDALGHEALRAEKAAIVRRFGTEVLAPGAAPNGGEVDRQILGRLVFGNGEALAALEAIVHPAVNRMTGEWTARRADSPACVINAALLHKSIVWTQLDALIVIRAPFPVRFLRARKRDALSPGEILARFAAQRDFPWNRSLAPPQNAGDPQFFPCPSDTYTVWNSGFPGSQRLLEKRIDRIVLKLTRF